VQRDGKQFTKTSHAGQAERRKGRVPRHRRGVQFVSSQTADALNSSAQHFGIVVTSSVQGLGKLESRSPRCSRRNRAQKAAECPAWSVSATANGQVVRRQRRELGRQGLVRVLAVASGTPSASFNCCRSAARAGSRGRLFRVMSAFAGCSDGRPGPVDMRLIPLSVGFLFVSSALGCC